MADMLPELRVLMGRKRVLWRRENGNRGGLFRFLTDLRITPENGRLLLTFSNGIENIGIGQLEVGGDTQRERVRRGVRTMPARQRIFQDNRRRPRSVRVGTLV